MAPDTSPPPAPARILVRGVNWLGDAVMTTPALLRLREAWPAAHFSLLTTEKLADLWLHHPAVDSVLAIRPSEGLLTVARQLRGERFDLGIVFPNSPRSALELWLGRIPRRVGYAANWRAPLLTQAVARPPRFVPMRKRTLAEIKRLSQGARPRDEAVLADENVPAGSHHLHHYLHLAATVGAIPVPVAPRLALTAAEVTAARARFDLSPGTNWLGLNAGAEYGPAKRWPAERFALVARTIAAWPGWGIAIFGGSGDVVLAGEIEHGVRQVAGNWPTKPALVNLAGRTTLRELCATLGACRVLVTNDTGPMHLAAALGTPVVALFGSTSPGLSGPGLPGEERHRLLRVGAPCSPCFLRECPIDLRCLRGIEVERVLETVHALARQRP